MWLGTIFSWMFTIACCLVVKVRARVRIRFSVGLVNSYAHVFLKFWIVIETERNISLLDSTSQQRLQRPQYCKNTMSELKAMFEMTSASGLTQAADRRPHHWWTAATTLWLASLAHSVLVRCLRSIEVTSMTRVLYTFFRSMLYDKTLW